MIRDPRTYTHTLIYTLIYSPIYTDREIDLITLVS